MNTNIIQLKGEVSFEKYQMAVRVLEAMDFEVQKENVQDSTVPLSHYKEVLKRKKDRENNILQCYNWEETKKELLNF